MGPKAPSGATLKKRKADGTSSSRAPSYDRSRFRNAQCEKHYATMPNRLIVQEWQVDLTDKGFPEAVVEIRKRHWETLVSYPNAAYPELVQEFFANAYEPDEELQEAKSFVRGKMVPFDANTINEILETDPRRVADDDDFELMSYLASTHRYETFNFSLSRVLNKISHEGTEWVTTAKGEPRKIFSRYLQPIPKFWATFLVTNILPNTNKTDVKVDRAKMIYSIMEGHRIDIGKVISNTIQQIANSENKGLAYPCLIHLLCERAGVNHTDVMPMRDPSILDMAYALKFCMTQPMTAAGGSSSQRAEPRQREARVRKGKDRMEAIEQDLSAVRHNLGAVHRMWEVSREDSDRQEDLIRQLSQGLNISLQPMNRRSADEVSQYVNWLPFEEGPEEQRGEEEEEDELADD